MTAKIILFKENLNWELLKKYSCYISIVRQIKIEKYVDNKRKAIPLMTELLLRFYLITKMGIQNEKIDFCYNENGKPILLNLENFHFSISHSNSMICIVISDFPIGIDTELCRDVNLNVAKRFFTDEECKQILLNTNPSKLFFKIWTQKEAYIKLFGLSFLELLRPSKKIKKVHYRYLEFESYIISVASEKTISKLSVKNILLNKVLKIFEREAFINECM
ncbi:MAG: 4'-phosphopantetheinyl transferase superfamily protein [Oscillospiraceae bacterium]|jgi:phosphopantetheine--protein transferase-like protein|nr:4'-phosphopantetheinyl transferase superfamily protein [Oscillospiraceae bacterium]